MQNLTHDRRGHLHEHIWAWLVMGVVDRLVYSARYSGIRPIYTEFSISYIRGYTQVRTDIY